MYNLWKSICVLLEWSKYYKILCFRFCQLVFHWLGWQRCYSVSESGHVTTTRVCVTWGACGQIINSDIGHVVPCHTSVTLWSHCNTAWTRTWTMVTATADGLMFHYYYCDLCLISSGSWCNNTNNTNCTNWQQQVLPLHSFSSLGT